MYVYGYELLVPTLYTLWTTLEANLGILENSVDHVDPVAVALVRHIDEGDLQRDNILRRHLRPGP
jgi:hypothetical protein